uniref:ATP synthase F0 subunit 8 n=1 Tax=Hetaerina titia TaxID=62019 RepID=UPI002E76BD44|nr:ATP synthase F0 subunit 8 [Hetaerina titia]WPM98320.1 ATP synthase F0 subunit 8 [Hetaerina titia]
MPQMAPMSWMMLFVMFSTTLLVMNTVNYYLYYPQMPKFQEKKKQIKTLNWKW